VNAIDIIAPHLAIISMILPTWFFALSAADVIQTRAKQWGVLYTDDEARALPFII